MLQYQNGNTSLTFALIAAGSNQPNKGNPPVVTLRRALDCLELPGIRVVAESRFFNTPAYPAGAGPDYVNACVSVETSLDPPDLLAALHRIEERFGRARENRWGARTVDLDIISHGAWVLPDLATQAEWRSLPPDQQPGRTPDELILPHPRVQDRAFVLVPLRDVAPAWRHPVTGLNLSEMIDSLPKSDVEAVKPVR